MLETTITRHNAHIDPTLSVWSWEIPVYLFFGGAVAGMMILGGWALLRAARGDNGRAFFSLQAPLLGFVLLNVGMLALLLDLTHKLYVWQVFTTFQLAAPMSWGSWVLIIVYGVLMVSALVRLPQTWPWLAARLPVVGRLSEAVGQPGPMRLLGAANLGLGVVLGIYTGILLNTMIARPLWNSGVLGPLFLFSGLSAGAALLHLAEGWLGRGPASTGMIGGAIRSLIQPVAADRPDRAAVDTLVRADLAFLAVELVLIVLLLINLNTSSLSHAHAARLLSTGLTGWLFWGVIVGAGVLLPILLQALQLAHRIPHTIVPALLVLMGGFTLRWVMVKAGQASHFVQAAAPLQP